MALVFFLAADFFVAKPLLELVLLVALALEADALEAVFLEREVDTNALS